MHSPEFVTSHTLAYGLENRIIDTGNGLPFDTDSYSRMKYGDRQATSAFATHLAERILENQPELADNSRAPEFLVAYKAVPPACYYLSRYCLDVINSERLSAGNEPGRVIQVFKSKVSATNYALANLEEREKELKGIDFSLEGRSLRDVPVVILDDIRITGSAEKCMLDVVRPENPASLTLGYIAIFDKEQAATRPCVENDLNSTTISGVEDITGFIIDRNFDLNIRTLKMILATPDNRLKPFLRRCPDSLLSDLARGTTSTGPDFIAQYLEGYGTLRQVIAERAQ